LFSTGKTIAYELNSLYSVVLLIVGVYLFVLFAVHPVYMKINKASLFVLGIGLLLMGDYVLINNPENYIYIADITKILGSVLIVLAWTNFFVSKKAKKQKEDSGIEIIEV
jgi:cytosine/uracil/thiamine/allantoin permease